MALYNNLLDVVNYQFNSGNMGLLVKDITKNYRLSQSMIESDAMMPYTVSDGELPWVVSQKIYGSPYYDWVIIMATNNVWPLSTQDLNAYITKTYTDPYTTHHYVNAAGYIVDSNATGAVAISNMEYEVAKNDAARSILIPKADTLPSILSEMGIK